MAFSDPNLKWSSLFKFDHSSTGELVGFVFVNVLFGLIFIAFIIYQLRQSVSEIRQSTPKKDRLRLISVIWSLLFFPMVFMSLFNVNLEISNTSITSYLIEFYTLSTIVGVTAGILVVIKDIRLLKQLRKDKNTL
jgi:drug/metabolite transporter (DMT)-like permease